MPDNGMMAPDERHLPQELPNVWRSDAAKVRRLGAEPQAATLEACADALERALGEHDNEPLTIPQAATETGLSESHLYRVVSEGRVPNAGRKGRPRIRRRDLPGCAFSAQRGILPARKVP